MRVGGIEDLKAIVMHKLLSEYSIRLGARCRLACHRLICYSMCKPVREVIWALVSKGRAVNRNCVQGNENV